MPIGRLLPLMPLRRIGHALTILTPRQPPIPGTPGLKFTCTSAETVVQGSGSGLGHR